MPGWQQPGPLAARTLTVQSSGRSTDYRWGIAQPTQGQDRTQTGPAPNANLRNLAVVGFFLPDVKLPTPYQESNHSGLRPVAHRMRP